MDGVLTDSEPLINAAAIAMFKEKGLVVKPEDFLPFVGTGEDRFIGGVAEFYNFPLDLPAAKSRTYLKGKCPFSFMADERDCGGGNGLGIRVGQGGG
jgi:beta-phosphoglucomutase-like phosphatase (HAD superfamily)